MQRRNLSDRIIKLDRNIRFVGVVNSRGEVIEGGFQHGVQPLLEGTDEQQMYIQSLSNMTMFQNYSDRLGKVRYSITEHEKVTLMTFPLDDGILCVSASPKANINKIRNKVSKVIKEKRPAAKNKKKKKKPTK
jgi:hypothetical protein